MFKTQQGIEARQSCDLRPGRLSRFSIRIRSDQRLGSIMVMSAAVLVLSFGFVAFTIDLGFIAITRAELRNASDAAVLAAVQELRDGLLSDSDTVAATAGTAAETIAKLNPAGDQDSVHIDTSQDIRFGQYQWDAITETWHEAWGISPYTLADVTVHRDRGSAVDVNGVVLDGPLPLFFGPAIGHRDANLVTRSAAALFPGVGFKITEESDSTINILQIALDEESWNALIDDEVGSDAYRYNEELGRVESVSDGILEANLYPSGSSSLPPGNRGTVDIGSPNNSTNDLKRQILSGINANDLAWFDGELRFDGTPLQLNGDTGLSAGIESALKSQIGKVKAIPLFTSVSGPGNNATYTICRFVGIRIMEVRLTGGPNNRRVVIQPAPFSHSSVVRGRTEIKVDSIFTSPVLVR